MCNLSLKKQPKEFFFFCSEVRLLGRGVKQAAWGNPCLPSLLHPAPDSSGFSHAHPCHQNILHGVSFAFLGTAGPPSFPEQQHQAEGPASRKAAGNQRGVQACRSAECGVSLRLVLWVSRRLL